MEMKEQERGNLVYDARLKLYMKDERLLKVSSLYLRYILDILDRYSFRYILSVLFSFRFLLSILVRFRFLSLSYLDLDLFYLI